MRKGVWTDEEIEKLKQYIEEGKLGEECAKLLGRPASSVSTKKKALGLKTKAAQEREGAEKKRVEKAKSMLESGCSIKQIAQEIGVGLKTAYVLANKCGYSGKTFVGEEYLHRSCKGDWAVSRFGIDVKRLRKMSDKELRQLCLKCTLAECDNCLGLVYRT